MSTQRAQIFDFYLRLNSHYVAFYPWFTLNTRFNMSSSNMNDGTADALAAVTVVTVAIVWLYLWLSGMPA